MKFLFLSFLFSLLVSPSYADDSGRLRDGRAYRTDSDGYRLIDQLAEYEVKLGELKQQVVVLEDELAEKNQELVSLRNKSGLKSQNTFRENDLLKEDLAAPVKIVFKEKIVEKECAAQKCEIPKLVCPDPACTENELLSLKSDLDKLNLENGELVRSRDENEKILALLKSEKERAELSAKSEIKAREEELLALNLLLDQTKRGLTEGEREIARAREELISEKAESAKIKATYAEVLALENSRRSELEKVNNQLASLNEKLKNKNFELSMADAKIRAQKFELSSADTRISAQKEEFKNSLALKEQELKLTQEKLTQLDQQLKTASYSRAKLAPLAVATPSAIRVVAQDRFSQSKQVLQAKLDLIEQKINERKNLSDALKAKPSYVKINSSPLNTSRGISLDILRARSERLATEKQAERVLFGLREIESILDEDIGLLKRIGSLQ